MSALRRHPGRPAPTNSIYFTDEVAPEYVTCVLNENFGDAKALASPMMAINYALLVMLAAQGIVPAKMRTRPPGLDACRRDDSRSPTTAPTKTLFYIAPRDPVVQATMSRDGCILARFPQRYRYDDDRMRQRELISTCSRRPCAAPLALDSCDRHRDTILASTRTRTRTCTAQHRRPLPACLVEQLERDGARLESRVRQHGTAIRLGACAISRGTGFPIDRRLTSALGFSGPTQHGTAASRRWTILLRRARRRPCCW